MSDIDNDLQRRLKQLADEAKPDERREVVVLERSRTKRRFVAITSGVMALLLVGGIAGASMIWTPDEDPAPPTHASCEEPPYDVAVFVEDDASEDDVETLRADLLDDAEVEEAIFFSKEAAFEEFKEHYKDQPEFWENLPEDALPMSFRVTLLNGGDVRGAARRFKNLPSVEDARTYSSMQSDPPGRSTGSTGTSERCVVEEPDPSSMGVTRLADTLFIDDELKDAVPTEAGFSLTQIIRNGPEETNHDYATVGVQMEAPVRYARVIFFVHPTAEAAADMRQQRLGAEDGEWRALRELRAPYAFKPVAVPNALPGTRCGIAMPQLLSCHAVLDRVMVLSQSSASTGEHRSVTEEEMAAATTLIRSFGSYLQRVYPDSEQVSMRTFARYFFEAAQEDMSANGVVEVNSEEGSICLEGTFSDNVVAAHLIDRAAKNGVALTFFDPKEEPEGAFNPGAGVDCIRTSDLDLLQLVIDEEERFAVDFHRGRDDEPGLVAELSSVIDLQKPHVRATVRRFMQARVEGAGAEEFLSADGWPESGPTGEPAPLYPDQPLEDFRIEFVDDLGDLTYEVGVTLVYANRTTGETLFVRERNDDFVISGARPGLEGP